MIGCVKSWWGFWHYYGRTGRNTQRFSLLFIHSACDFTRSWVKIWGSPATNVSFHLYDYRRRQKEKFCANIGNNPRKTFSAKISCQQGHPWIFEKTCAMDLCCRCQGLGTFVFRVHTHLFSHRNVHLYTRKLNVKVVMKIWCPNSTVQYITIMYYPIKHGNHFYIQLIDNIL